ncbi:MAG: DUF58 domain-containing protein [Flammeovirgaceae bacterium]
MQLIRSLYTNSRLYLSLSITIFLCLVGFAYPIFFVIAQPILLCILVLALVDLLLLYRLRQGIEAQRFCPEKLSNGDENELFIQLKNHYRFLIQATIIDEVPHQFQVRDFNKSTQLAAGTSKNIAYTLRPIKRGAYEFGQTNVYVTGIIGFFSRRYRFGEPHPVPVYPSYLQMRKYEFLAISNRLAEIGIKKVRKVGHNMEFDQIRDYVRGDDYRSINWKATARKRHFMVNQYQDEKSQQIYCLIDKGRAMRMPFENLTLLDYAINASLVLSNIAIRKQDKAGLITFNDGVKTLLPASDRNAQMNKISEALYREKTAYKESDFENLYIHIKRRLSQRALLLLFTNFEALPSLERQLKYLRAIAKKHLLVVVFFENTETKALLRSTPTSTEEVYIKTIGEKLSYDKRQMVKELKKYGIYSILTPPAELTVNALNKYLELKARGLI